jgi:hypothetical protein
MVGPANTIPDFRQDGYLPEGLFLASEAEVTFRFGTETKKRRRLVHRIRHWIRIARDVRAPRLLIDGSFITAKSDPNDVDAVILLPSDFGEQLAANLESAVELEEMLLTRRPEEIFAADDESDWNEWLAERAKVTDGAKGSWR